MSIKTSKLTALHDSILVTDMNFEEQKTASGIIIKSDDGKTEGIKPRWGKVFCIGPDQKDVKVGEWILVEHGRWTRGLEIELADGETITVRKIDVNAILASADERPSDITLGASNKSTVQEFDFSKSMF